MTGHQEVRELAETHVRAIAQEVIRADIAIAAVCVMAAAQLFEAYVGGAE